MEALSSFFDSQTRRSYDSLKNFRRISPDVQTHLKRVYLTLCCSEIVYAIGAYLHMTCNIGGILTTLGFIRCITRLHSTPHQQSSKRLSFYFLYSLLQGASISRLIVFAFNVDPRFLIAIDLGRAIAFLCFAVAAMLARRRTYLYLIALLSSVVSVLMCLRFASVFMLEIYIGFLIFLGYILLETQEIIERANHDDKDYLNHSVSFFTDFVGFLLMKFAANKDVQLKNSVGNKEEKKKEKKKKKKKGRN